VSLTLRPFIMPEETACQASMSAASEAGVQLENKEISMNKLMLAMLLLVSAFSPIRAAVEDCARLIPPDGLPGWTRDNEILWFSAEDLWQHINGAAEQFLAYGCQGACVSHYRGPDGTGEISVELYALADTLNAFGIWASEAAPNAESVNIGGGACIDGPMLLFFSGKYYVKLQAFPAGELMAKALRDLAARISSGLPGGEFPGVFARFPTEGLVARPFGYIPQGILGLRELTAAYSARYRSGSSEFTVFLFERQDPSEAQALVEAVRKHLADRGETPPTEAGAGEFAGFTGRLPYRGDVTVLSRGTVALVFSGAADQAEIAKIIKGLR